MYAQYENYSDCFNFYKRAIQRDNTNDIIVLKYHVYNDHTECTMLDDGAPF